MQCAQDDGIRNELKTKKSNVDDEESSFRPKNLDFHIIEEKS